MRPKAALGGSGFAWAFYDFLPTCAEPAGVTLPADAKPDGISVLPVLLGGTAPQRQYLYWEVDEPWWQQAVRFGGGKAVRPAPDARVELHDLKTDPTESHDLAREPPQLVQKAQQLLREAHVDFPLWPIRYPTPGPCRAGLRKRRQAGGR